MSMVIEEALRHQYNEFARQYDGVDQGIDLILARLTTAPDASVLDVGCGTGNLTLRLAEKNALRRVVGVDLSESALEIARNHARDRKLSAYEFIRASACSLPFRAGEFDVVVSNMVFHLIPDHRKAFAEAVRVLRPSGKAVIQFHGGGPAGAEWMEVFRQAWQEAIPDRQPPVLIPEIPIRAVEEDLVAAGVRSFDISWRHRVRRVPAAGVAKIDNFCRIVLGFWRWGLPAETVRRIDERITQLLLERAAGGHLVITVNVLLVEFQTPGE